MLFNLHKILELWYFNNFWAKYYKIAYLTKIEYICVHIFLFNVENAKKLFKTNFVKISRFYQNSTLFCKFMQSLSKSHEKRLFAFISLNCQLEHIWNQFYQYYQKCRIYTKNNFVTNCKNFFNLHKILELRDLNIFCAKYYKIAYLTKIDSICVHIFSFNVENSKTLF